MPGQYPEVEIVLHPAVEHAERGQRFQLLGHHRVAGINPQMRLGHLAENEWIANLLRAGYDGIAETNVDLYGAAGTVQHTHQRHPDTRVIGFLADLGCLYGLGLKRYPILDLDLFFTDLGIYLRNIEEVIIRTIADYGLKGERLPGATGVWLDVGTLRARKICAIGIRTSRWVTMHGFAFNVNTQLDHFNFIIPCGISDKAVTSLEKELGHPVPMDEVKEKVKHYFAEVFQCTII